VSDTEETPEPVTLVIDDTGQGQAVEDFDVDTDEDTQE